MAVFLPCGIAFRISQQDGFCIAGAARSAAVGNRRRSLSKQNQLAGRERVLSVVGMVEMSISQVKNVGECGGPAILWLPRLRL